MITLRIDGSDIKTIVDNLPDANIGLSYANKALKVVLPMGAKFNIRPKAGDRQGHLMLVAPWKEIRYLGLSPNKIVGAIWPKLQTNAITLLKEMKSKYDFPDGMLGLVKNNEYCGIDIDMALLRDWATIPYQGLMVKIGTIAFKDDYIEIGVNVFEMPPVLTRESDEEIPEEDVE